MTTIGNKKWAIAGSNIPAESHGEEPDFTSRDSLWLLNACAIDAEVSITIYYADRDPVGPYEIGVAARRVRQIRFNDLIDPQAIPLCVDYGAVIESTVPIVVQLSQVDTRQARNARTLSLAFPAG